MKTKNVYIISEKDGYIITVATTEKVAKARLELQCLEHNQLTKTVGGTDYRTLEDYKIEERGLWTSADLNYLKDKIKKIKEAE